jgi:hypothetical protein
LNEQIEQEEAPGRFHHYASGVLTTTAAEAEARFDACKRDSKQYTDQDDRCKEAGFI